MAQSKVYTLPFADYCVVIRGEDLAMIPYHNFS